MSSRVTLSPSGHQFTVEGRDSLLQGGLKAGLRLDYGCSNGTCGDCRARIIEGEVTKLFNSDFTFGDAEKSQRHILTCAHAAASDSLVLEAEELGDLNEIPVQSIPIKIVRIQRPVADVAIVQARTPRSRRFRFLAGQAVRLSVGTSIDGPTTLQLPVASCPCDDRNLEFHIPRRAGDPFCEPFFDDNEAPTRLDLKGPYGTMVLAEDSPNRPIFVAEETGFAAIRSLVEHAMSLDENSDNPRGMSVYWRVSRADGHYLANLCRSWTDALDDFDFHAANGLSPEALARQIASDHANPADRDVYVIGSPEFVTGLSAGLIETGFPATQLRTHHLPA